MHIARLSGLLVASALLVKVPVVLALDILPDRMFTIQNLDSQNIEYRIFNKDCVTEYSKGGTKIDANGEAAVPYFEAGVKVPSSVCVVLQGKSGNPVSMVVKTNKNCVVTVKNAGFMKGIFAETNPDCK